MSVASTDEAAFKEINVKNGVSIVHQVVMCGFARFRPVRHSGSVIGGGRSLKAFNQSSQSAELRRLTIGTDAQRISAAVCRGANGRWAAAPQTLNASLTLGGGRDPDLQPTGRSRRHRRLRRRLTSEIRLIGRCLADRGLGQK